LCWLFSGKSTKINDVLLALDSDLFTVAHTCDAAGCPVPDNIHKLAVCQGDCYRELSVEWGIDNDNMFGNSLGMLIDGLMEGKEMSREFHIL